MMIASSEREPLGVFYNFCYFVYPRGIYYDIWLKFKCSPFNLVFKKNDDEISNYSWLSFLPIVFFLDNLRELFYNEQLDCGSFPLLL